ncbi:MAG: radical SAM protein, partial [Clostridia bacterium]|nr:radical SAM protein [Clostridia bacterium]
MRKKNIYLVQPSFTNDSTVHFPYAIGTLASYAWTFEDVRDAYDLKGILFLREDPDTIVDSLQSPFLIGFSCYIWNYEYNKTLARKVKERFPECCILFGGPQIPEDASPLAENPFVDVLIHNEGEIPFRTLLQSLSSHGDLHQVNNISFRDGDAVVTTPFVVECEFNFPSPITSGFFDRLLREHPDLEFQPMIETNRGCPNHCAYCSWANNKARVRLVPLERVYSDLTWISEHKMEFASSSDANFGMFPRDEQIADKIVELYKKNGYPKKFQVSYTKDSDERVFRITEKLSRVGICKGVTLSFQTMSEEAQKNIGRSNMDISFYKRLSERYDEANIPTYTELIIGLPGETFESFRDGVEELLESGRHHALLVHLCELLPLAEMHRKSYMEKYKIEYAKIPLNQPHAPRQGPQDVAEYSKVVISTYSMPREMWKRTVLFATCVSCCHHLGLLQMVALYLYNEKGVLYSDFYLALLD